MAGYINITDTIQNATVAWHNGDSAEFDSQVSPGLIVVLRIVLGFFFCLGVAGNVLTITSIAMTRSLHSVPNIYLCSLAASDLILCTVAMPSTFVGYTVRIPDELCSVLAEIIFTCITVSLMSITMVAVNRYVLVVKPRQYYLGIYTTRNVKISIAAIWLLGILYGTPPHFGFGEYVYNVKMGGCFVRAETMDSWLFTKIFGFGLAFLPAMLVSLYCYVNIGITFSRARRQVASVEADQPKLRPASCSSVQQVVPQSRTQVTSSIQESSTKNKDAAARRRSIVTLLKKLAVVWGLFMCCWLPVVLTHSVDYTGLVDPRVLHVAFAIAQCNSAVHVITYGALSKDIRTAYRHMLSCKWK
ncbi:5-hydroxytryptamine receptor 1D [Lamellibrachia satsuma]|nr:5-hydroxytryptamine receptor 1D [Lamellibrachia satsuma]